MRQWEVRVETRRPEASSDAVGLAPLSRLRELLFNHGGVVVSGVDSWSASVTVTAPNPGTAFLRAAEILDDAVDQASLPIWPYVRSEVIRTDELEHDPLVPRLPELVGAAEATKILGVSRQRFRDLRLSGRLPEPAIEVEATPLWLRGSIEAFAENRQRHPGRLSELQRLAREGSRIVAIRAQPLPQHPSIAHIGIERRDSDVIETLGSRPMHEVHATAIVMGMVDPPDDLGNGVVRWRRPVELRIERTEFERMLGSGSYTGTQPEWEEAEQGPMPPAQAILMTNENTAANIGNFGTAWGITSAPQ